jgi:hypothetical protein
LPKWFILADTRKSICFPHFKEFERAAHLVSYAGRAYRRWNNAEAARELPSGTVVDVVAVGALIEEALQATLNGRRRGSRHAMQ